MTGSVEKPVVADGAAMERVARRLGAEVLDRRIALEEFRDDEFHHIFTTKCTWLKVHLVRPAERLLLRGLGLWAKGRRELLEPVARENVIELGERLPAAFDGYRILHLSDLHIDIDEDLPEAVSRLVGGLDYDLCVMTGDYRSLTIGPYDDTLRMMGEVRRAIRTDVLCVMGNHDFIGMVPGLEDMGFRVLLNECETIRRGGAALAVCGIDDPVIFKTHDIAKALSGSPEGCVKLLLSHSCRVAKEAEALGADILLAGHTHGGQICLPGGWQPLKNERMPRKYCKGPWRFGRLRGYTTAGCGASGLACRLNCPAEAVIHVLRRNSAP